MSDLPRRPVVTKEMILNAATEIAKGTMLNPRNIAEHYDAWEDGYDLARKLEDDGYSICARDVELLDRMRVVIDEIHENACWEWAKENNIQPSYPVGTELKEGVIVAISKHNPASYEVKIYGCTQKGRVRIVRFEDAQPTINTSS